MISALVSDCLAQASLVLIVSASARHFRIYNLAAGSFFILGGWLAQGALSETTTSINWWWMALLLAPICIYSISPLILRSQGRDHPFTYLAVSLGVALITDSILQDGAMPSHSSSLALPAQHITLALSMIAMVVAAGVTLFMSNSGTLSSLAVRWRFAEDSDVNIWGRISLLLAAQVLLLLITGALTSGVHKGLAGGAEQRTVISLLALFACGMRPWLSVITVTCATLLIHAIEASSSPAASFAPSIVLGGFSVFTGLLALPERPRINSRDVSPVLRVPNKSDAVMWFVFAIVACIVGISTLTVAQGSGAATIVVGVYGACLAAIAWILLRVCGVLTVALPALATGSALVFTLSWNANGLEIASLLLAPLIIGAASYLLLLRLLQPAHSLVVDLGFAFSIFSAATSSTTLSGSNGVLVTSSTYPMSVTSDVALGLLAVVVACLIAALVAANHHPSLRSRVLANASFRIGALNGMRPFRTALATFAGLLVVTLISQAILRIHFPILDPGELSVENGLLILASAYLSIRGGIASSVAIYIGIFLFAEVLGQGHGTLKTVLIGTALIGATLMSKRGA